MKVVLFTYYSLVCFSVFSNIFSASDAELWGYKNENEWMVSHYLFHKNSLN